MVSLCVLVFVAAGYLVSSTLAVSIKNRNISTCAEIRVRKEWRDLTVDERSGYINAVLCLQSLPPLDPTRIAVTRYEEFQATHIQLTERIHSVGHFLPWHRHLVTLYANALRDECGYNGPTAFWDWARDADSDKPMVEWPIFDTVAGFGGDGVAGTYTLPPDPKNESSIGRPWKYKGCVQTGPFKDRKIRLGPGKLRTDHCLVRGFDEAGWRAALLSSHVESTLKGSLTFDDFRLTIDSLVNGIHSGGHAIIGGEMMNVYSAGADPLFYLHHANLDRVWWLWQRADPDMRTYAISGPTTQNGSIPVTLDFILDFPALGPNVTVGDVMNTSAEPGCFTYDY